MSDSQGQNNYIESLKQIKEIEDKVQIEIETHKKYVEQEMLKLQEDLKNSIAETNQKGRNLVETTLDQSRSEANKEAERIVAEARQKSGSISFQADQKTIKQIIQIMFSDL